jgi:hypothetical protein
MMSIPTLCYEPLLMLLPCLDDYRPSPAFAHSKLLLDA